MKVGLIGDTHIPNRAKEIPEFFLEVFKKEKVDLILHLGDINDPKVLEELDDIAPAKAVKGNTDYGNLQDHIILDLEGYRILAFHSDNVHPRGDIKQILSIAKEKKANIVIHGHTHLPRFLYKDGVYIISPGSATGVRSGEIKETIKSIAVMEISDKVNIKFYII